MASRKSYTLKEKCEIICEIENGKSKTQICHERNLSKSTVGTIWNNRQAIRGAFESKNGNTKKMRKSQHHDVDLALKKWFMQQRLYNVKISGNVLKTKAEELGRKLTDGSGFVCSHAWIERWKRRHNICRGKIDDEVIASVNMKIIYLFYISIVIEALNVIVFYQMIVLCHAELLRYSVMQKFKILGAFC